MEPIVIAGIVLIPLGLVSVLTTAVYFDAKKNEVDDPSKWAGLVLLTGGTGLIVYALERADATTPDEYDGPRTLPGGSGRSSADGE